MVPERGGKRGLSGEKKIEPFPAALRIWEKIGAPEKENSEDGKGASEKERARREKKGFSILKSTCKEETGKEHCLEGGQGASGPGTLKRGR